MHFQLTLKKSPFAIILLCIYFLFLCNTASAEPPDDIIWKSLETKHTIIHYQNEKELKKFHVRIDYGPKSRGLKRLFSSSAPDNLEEIVIEKVDILFKRVQKILGMRKKMEKVNVNVYQDKDQLHKAFMMIYRTKCHLRAWYRYKNNTVYVNVRDLHEGMLAHELAHAIIDHYLLVRPPRATAEILARYVDSHLK